MTRVLSGIQPTGQPHIGNYLGATRRWSAEQTDQSFFCIVDLHAITVRHDPAELRERTLDQAAWLLAIGIDPEVSTLFVQSHVPEHTQLSWVLECTATIGEAQRMVQFKEKGRGNDSVSVGLLTYPVLQAADILIYQADEVPIGDDQRQHLELTRDVAQRFNHRYGDTFTVPTPTFPVSGARIMDLQVPDAKMSKSNPEAGTILLGEDPTRSAKKVMRAVTDSGSEVRPGSDKPGVTNLLDLLSACTGRGVDDLVAEYGDAGYGTLKKAVAEAVNDVLAPVRARHAELVADPGQVASALAEGRDKARTVAAATVADVYAKVGFLPSAGG